MIRWPERRQWAWAMNDWANSGFATTVLVSFFPIFFSKYWAAGLDDGKVTFYLGVVGSASASLVVMLLAPWLGALADRHGWKKRFLAGFTSLGIIATGSLALIGHGAWPLALGVYVLASIGFFGSLSFYDALLLSVARREDTDRISAFGFGLGYLGGGLLFAFDVAMVLNPRSFGLADEAAATKLAFFSAALWWGLFSLPLFLRVPEAAPKADAGAWRELLATLRKVLRNRPVLRFLLAYWLYIDAIGTVQQMAVNFGDKLGFPTSVLIGALLMVQFVSFPAAIGFGWLAGRIGTKRAIYLALSAFIAVACWAYILQKPWQFYVMAGVVALVQGGAQSLSRSFFARLIPADAAGEYFGFYNMLGKFAAVIGPAVVGTVALITDNQRLALFVLVFFFIGGMWLLSRVHEEEVKA